MIFYVVKIMLEFFDSIVERRAIRISHLRPARDTGFDAMA